MLTAYASPMSRLTSLDELGEVEMRITAAHDALRERDGLIAQLNETRERLAGAEAELATRLAVAQIAHTDIHTLAPYAGFQVWTAFQTARAASADRRSLLQTAARGLAAETGLRAEVLRRQVRVLRQRLADLGDVDWQIADAEIAKAGYLADSMFPGASRLAALAEERGRLEAELCVLVRAFVTGRGAQVALGELEAELGMTSSWATADATPGPHLAKDMDLAVELGRNADSRLEDFRRELADVDRDTTVATLAVSDGMRFVDGWLTGLFAHVRVQSRIQDIRATARRAGDVVATRLSQCARREADVQRRLRAIAMERAALVG